MRKQVAFLGIIIAIVAVAMSSVGVASAHGGTKGEWDWQSVNAQLVFTGYDTTDIKPLGKNARESLYDGPETLDGRFKVQSAFTGILLGQFGDQIHGMSDPILAGGNLTSMLNIDLDSGLGSDGFPDGSCGLFDLDGDGQVDPCGTEVGVTIGTATLNLGSGTVTGRIVGRLTLIGGVWLGNIPPDYLPIHQPLAVIVDANFLITDGTGDFEDARGMLKIKGDVLPSGGGASVTGKVQVPTDD